MSNNLEKVRAAVIKAVPSVEIKTPWHKTLYCTIHLADVLLALKALPDNRRAIQDQYHLITGALDDTMWNLRNDNLDAQSEECLAFLANLLSV